MINPFERIELFILRTFRKVFRIGRNPNKRKSYIAGTELNDFIRNSITVGRPFMVARFGSIELNSALYPYLLSSPLIKRYRLFLQHRIPFIRKNNSYAESLIGPLCNNAGFFPNDISLLDKFSSVMQNDVPLMDCCCCCEWEDEGLFDELFSSNMLYARLEDMEPYDYNNPWSAALKGKRVLVIHPFIESIKKQYSKKELLWEDRNVLPAFELKTIKAVQSIAGEKTQFTNWFEALDSMKSQMNEIDYDIAIIGCGAYGFHLAAHAKRTGHMAIHLGGATQILFGIKGKRWEGIPAVSKFFNDYWAVPSPNEVPMNSKSVEDGCYW